MEPQPGVIVFRARLLFDGTTLYVELILDLKPNHSVKENLLMLY